MNYLNNISNQNACQSARLIQIRVRDNICPQRICTPTLKNRRKSILPYYMAARKNTSRKKRLMKRTRQNRPVPTWVVIRTNKKIRTNPKRRLWRRSDVNVG